MVDAAARPRKNGFFADLFVGAVSSGATNTITYPIHRVKVILQTQDINPRVLSKEIPRYDFLTTFTRIIREQGGLASLWRGNVPYLLRHIPGTSLGFAFKDKLLRAFPHHDPHTHFWQFASTNFLSGSLAGGAALAVVYPLELITVRMAADLGADGARQFGRGMLDCWRQVVSQEGLAASYRGLPIALLSIMTYRGLYFGLFDSSKELLLGSGHSLPDVFHKWVLAQTTVYMASSVAYPLDVIRKRLVVDVASTHRQYAGTWDCIKKIAQREGVRGFYRFYPYDMIFRFGGGFVLVAYDELKHGLEQMA